MFLETVLYIKNEILTSAQNFFKLCMSIENHTRNKHRKIKITSLHLELSAPEWEFPVRAETFVHTSVKKLK